MKVTGLITEYNPFHQGHKYHIEKAKEAAIMYSGEHLPVYKNTLELIWH